MSKPTHFKSEESLAASWISRMAAGEADALTALYRLYHRPLWTIIHGMLGDRSASEEILQDTFVRAFQKAGDFDPGKGPAFAWLVTIGRRMAIDRIRRNRSRPDQGNAEHLQETADNIPEGDARDIHRNTEFSLLHEALEFLPERQREAVHMAFIEGYTHHEIAELTGTPLGTVKSDLYRGLNKLRENYFGNND